MHQVSVLVPNYKTLELTKLCLRLLRKFTDLTVAKVIVIDNDSQDESLAYLKTLPWITLLQRQTVPDETPALAHSRALDLALSVVDTPYVLSIHTDTLVKNTQWLPFLLSLIQQNTNIAGVGSWKLEMPSRVKLALKAVETWLQRYYYRLIGKTEHALTGYDHNYYYLRSHCALYRTALLNKYQLTFSAENEVAGKVMHKQLIGHGHEMLFIPAEQLIGYLDHLNHATLLLNPTLSAQLKPRERKKLDKIAQHLQQFKAQEILQDHSLDLAQS